MQTIYLDISNKGVVPTIYAKQNDVGRKFAVILTDSGLPYIPANGSAFSVWYKGASGEGNYTDIGDKSAFSLSGNKVEVEMIVQMLSVSGDGILCLTLNSPDGKQISSWNIPYICEFVPGAESEKAEEYYTAFSKAVEELPYPDESLSIKGRAADAASVGAAIKKAAPHNLLDNSDFRNPVNQRGLEGYSGNNVYTIDRWVIASDNGKACGFVVDNGYLINLNGATLATLTQQIVGLDQNKRYTFAYEDADGNIHIPNPADIVWNNNYAFARIIARANTTVKWAALYEGEYTAETIPEYHPKGYAVELAECQRHYVKLSQIIPMFCFDSGNRQIRGTLIAPTKMREFPRVENHHISWIFTSGYDTSTGSNTTIAVNEANDGIDVTVGLPANITPEVGSIHMVSVNVWLSADL